jgi:hypothetical protein
VSEAAPTPALTTRGPGWASGRSGALLAGAATLFVAAAVAAVAASASRSGAAGPLGGFIVAEQVGFDGVASSEVVSPVTVTLENPRDREASLRVVATSGGSRVEEAVVLPAGSRRRVSLALRLEEESLVEVLDGAVVVDRREIPDLEDLDSDRHVLILDGRPPDKRVAGGSRRNDPTLQVSSIDGDAAPVEAAVYTAFGAVLLRGCDPAGWTADQREALLEHVLDGGTLILVDCSPKDPATQRFFDGFAAPATTVKLVGRAAKVKPVGLGRVVAFGGDVVQAAYANDQAAADVKQRLGDLLQEGLTGRTWPRPSELMGDDNLTRLDGPGATTRGLVGGFVFVYLLAVGPGLGLLLRRASRKRLALGTAALVLGFTLLAPVVAGVVTRGSGTAFVLTTAWVPRAGPTVEVGEIVVSSGGASRYAFEVEGERVATTVILSAKPGERSYGNNGWEWSPERPNALITRRGDPARVEVAMPPWGKQRALVQVTRADLKPIEATLRRTQTGAQATIKNVSGGPLRDAIVLAEGQAQGSPGFLSLGTIAPDEVKTVDLPRALPGSDGRRMLHEVLDIPEDWLGWQHVVPAITTGDAGAASYRLVSRIEPGLRVVGRSLEVVTHGLRIDPLVGVERGYLGLVVEPADAATAQGPWRVRIVRPSRGGPAATAGVQAGCLVTSIEDQTITTVAQFRSVLAQHRPGEQVTLGTFDPSTRQQTSVRVRLVTRAAMPEGD